MSARDGGPAFPQMRIWNAERAEYEDTQQFPGMSLRDYFAGQALAAMGMWVPPYDYVDDEGNWVPEHTTRYQRLLQQARAEWAYASADAMLKAREVPE